MRPYLESTHLVCFYSRFWGKSKEPKYHHPRSHPSGQLESSALAGVEPSLDPELKFGMQVRWSLSCSFLTEIQFLWWLVFGWSLLVFLCRVKFQLCEKIRNCISLFDKSSYTTFEVIFGISIFLVSSEVKSQFWVLNFFVTRATYFCKK